jgi:septum formation inhibitor MinC
VISVNALLALRSGLVYDEPALTLVGILLVLAAIGAVVYGNLRGRALAGHLGHHVPPVAPAFAITALAAVTLIACAAGVASVLVRH